MFSGREFVNFEKPPQSQQLQQQTTKNQQINVSSGRIGERLVIRTTTRTGQGLRYTLTRPFRSAEPRPSHSSKSHRKSCSDGSPKSHRKSCSDGSFDIPTANFTKKLPQTATTAATAPSTETLLLRSSSVDSHNGFFGETYRSNAHSREQENFWATSEKNVKFASAKQLGPFAEERSDATVEHRLFAERFREKRASDYGYNSKRSLPTILSESSHTSPSTSSINREVNAFLATDSMNNIEQCSLPDLKKPRRQVKKRAVFYEKRKAQPTMTGDDEVRFRRREAAEEELKSDMPSRCISTPQSLNRSIPCVYESSQFTALRSTSYIDGMPEHTLPSRTRTAVVGPNTVHRSREEPSYDYGPIDKRGGVRAYCSSDIARTYTSPPTPITRYDCGDPPPYYSHRRSTQPEDGLLYPICSTPLSRSPRCEFPQGGSPIDSSMLPRAGRPRDLRITPPSSLMLRTTTDGSTTPSKKHGTTSASRMHGTQSGAVLNNGASVGTSSMVVDGMVPMNSTVNSKKMMVAPQPQNSHHRERNDSCCKSSNQQRRQSMGAIVPAYTIPMHSDNWRNRDRESPSNEHQLAVDDRRTKNSNDIRVAVLEQRVRELEAAVISGQTPSTSIPTTSFIIPVIGTKNSSRILRSTSGQFVVSAATTPTTQQLMAQEVVDKEIEVERLQSQLRKCYSRMEMRQVQYDEEVNAFRRESEEAKAQLTKVKARLGELEKECVAYREKAMAVDANRNSAVASSLEKISAQEREIAALRGELERNMQLVKDFERIKKEYEFLELQNEALNATLDSKENTIRDLEDNIFAMKMDASCKVESGSATPKADAFSLFDIESTKFFNEPKESDVPETKGGSSPPSPSSEAGTSGTLKRTPKLSSVKNGQSSSSSENNDNLLLSTSASKLIRKQLNTTLECRLLAKCLKDVAAKAISGDAPSVNRLLGCRSDSMSESEPEPVMTDSSAMSSRSAERHIKKITEDLERVEKDLNLLRESFVEYYQKKIADELKEDESCRIQ